MLEKITGKAYEALVNEKLFEPLHMDTAGFGPPGTPGQVDQPWGHVRKLFLTIPVPAEHSTRDRSCRAHALFAG